MSEPRQFTEHQVHRGPGLRTRVQDYSEWERDAANRNLCVGECQEDHRVFREMRQRQEALAEREKEELKQRHRAQYEQYLRMMPDADRAITLSSEAMNRIRKAIKMYRGSLKKSYDELDEAHRSIQGASSQGQVRRRGGEASSSAPNAVENARRIVDERRLAIDLANYSYVSKLAAYIAELQQREHVYRGLLARYGDGRVQMPYASPLQLPGDVAAIVHDTEHLPPLLRDVSAQNYVMSEFDA